MYRGCLKQINFHIFIKLIFIFLHQTLYFIISVSGCIEKNPTVKSNIIYVDNGGGADYTQIQDAIDNADDGNIIYVQNGTYFETLVINKSISLIGASPDKTIIYFNGSNNDKNNVTGVLRFTKH